MRTLGSPLLALLLQAQGGAASESSGTGILEPHRPTRAPISQGRSRSSSRCSRSSPGASSSTSWWTFRRAARQSAQFLDVFRRSNKFSEVQAVCRSLGDSPLVGLFQAGYAELTAQLRQSAPRRGQRTQSAAARRTSYLKSLHGGRSRAAARVGGRSEQARAARLVSGDDGEHRAVHRAVRHGVGHHDRVRADRRRPDRPTSQSVAPGIAEALVATAAGLAAAIPAVLFYNHLSQRVKLFASEMDDFAMEFLNIAERNFT